MKDNSYLGQYAGYGSRAAAYLLDLAVIYLLRTVVTWGVFSFAGIFDLDLLSCQPFSDSLSFFNVVCWLASGFLVIFNLTIAFVYYMFFWILAGQTIGKYVLGLRVIRMDGKRMNFRRSLLRYLGYLISLAPLTLGFLWILIDDRRQGWHDKIARTCVVYAWPGGISGQFLSRFDRWVNRRFKLEPPASEIFSE